MHMHTYTHAVGNPMSAKSMSMKISLFVDKYTINISYKAIVRDIWQHTYE